MVEVLARDLAGHSDITMVDIYILRDNQRVKIIINEIPERVQQFQEEFISLLSNITRAIVNTDDMQVGGVGGCGGCVCLCAGVCVACMLVYEITYEMCVSHYPPLSSPPLFLLSSTWTRKAE
jgi:hypothetical protein